MENTIRHTAGVLFLTITALFTPYRVHGQQLPFPSSKDSLTAANGRDGPASSRADSQSYPHHAFASSAAGHETLPPDPEPYAFQSTGTTSRAPERGYGAGPVRRFFFNDAYRDVWTTPVPIPVIDLQTTAGGLTPVERGGGEQTTSLHLISADSLPYVLRSVQKKASRSLEPIYWGTIVSDIVNDLISSINPWGAVMVPELARAAGVLHTQPTLVVIPDDPALGEFRDEYAGMLALFERKPDENQSDAARFGYAENVVGSDKMYEEVREDNDERVDQRAFARARLFDMLIGDFDRHDDQWRWAEFETDNGTRYVGVPRDRDFAFVKFDGFFNELGRRFGPVVVKRFANFTPEIHYLLGLNWQGSELDIRFTSALSRSDWVEIADSIRAQLTDTAIARAVRQLPDPVFAEIGPYTIAALKSRRDQLPAVASHYYAMLARTVDVVGSDKHERFDIERRDDGTTEVVVHKTHEEGDAVRELYRRTFYPDETNEIRLYGLGGKDQFVVEGGGHSDIRLRIVGGAGDDRFEDRSATPGQDYFYDTEKEESWDLRPGAHVRLSGDSLANDYQGRRFELTKGTPRASLSYNSFDGVSVGLGFAVSKPGFRREPYAVRHSFFLEYAERSKALSGYYDGRITDVVGNWDTDLRATVRTENNFHSFYGFGNETGEDDYLLYRARLRWLTASPSLILGFAPHSSLSTPHSSLTVGPLFQFTSIEAQKGISPQNLNFSPSDLTDKYFAGIRTSLVIDKRDSLLNPHSGFRWQADADANAAVRTSDDRYVHLGTDLRYFYTLPVPGQFTLALRAGGAHNFGTFEFFQANLLGGHSNLRGFARGRFAGRTMAYTSAELRTKLLDYNVYLAKGSLGAYGFVDNGRVWWDGDNSALWHTAYGGGLWTTPFNLVVLTGGVAFSDEG
ncbi:MAG TPA: BamA/TamA family outer membrane protein, partial [Rhodothermales bacterium]|nr:BamA/TamA family outer membrane protein [Rhodothermales bacterium]